MNWDCLFSSIRTFCRRARIAALFQLVAPLLALNAATTGAAALLVGVAETDITPERPIHLINQLTAKESEGVHQRLNAKALAFRDPRLKSKSTCVLIVFDGIGVPPQTTAEVRRRLAPEIPAQNITLCATHDHCAPHLTGLLPGIFGDALPDAHRRRINEYTARLTGKLTDLAREAVRNCQPRSVFRGTGKVGFAINRRKVVDGRWTGWGNDPNGAVDHSLPLLCVRNPDDSIAAVMVSYACHNTSIGGRDFDNRISGDWVGFAREAIERDHPGAVALVTLGCAGEARPNEHGGLEAARRFGEMIAKEVARLASKQLAEITSPPACSLSQAPLSLAPPPEAAELRSIIQSGAKGRSRAAKARARIADALLNQSEANQAIPLALDYPIQSWRFGSDLTWVFLAGEVVVDYARRMRREFGATVWPIAYANDLPCYIPSKRILREGGYEADQSMAYYGRLQTLLPSSEDRIFSELRRQLGSAR